MNAYLPTAMGFGFILLSLAIARLYRACNALQNRVNDIIPACDDVARAEAKTILGDHTLHCGNRLTTLEKTVGYPDERPSRSDGVSLNRFPRPARTNWEDGF